MRVHKRLANTITAQPRPRMGLFRTSLSEQKSAKIISLLEEQRRDHPHLENRVDTEAAAMAVAADPQTVLDAIKDSAAASPAADRMNAQAV
jgi:hypothetical protein